MNPQQFIAARRDSELAVLEGFHAFKHALRFEAEVVDAVTSDKEILIQLTKKLAPDVLAVVEDKTREVSSEEFIASSPIQIKSGVIAIAKRRFYDENIIATTERMVVWLDNPKDHENIGAIIRLGAGLGAGAVVVSGDMDVWNPGVLRGSAGLHYCVPVISTSKSPAGFDKRIYVFDDKGEPFEDAKLRHRSILVFGSERHGVSEPIKEQAEAIIAIPMEKGVSSFNLATSVAIGLYYFTAK